MGKKNQSAGLEPKADTQVATGVLAKLKAQKAEGGMTRKVTLPISKIQAQIPNHIAHRNWMVAQNQGKGDISKSQAALIAAAVSFEGERLTLTDIMELLDARDFLFLVNEIFDSEDDEEGNAQES